MVIHHDMQLAAGIDASHACHAAMYMVAHGIAGRARERLSPVVRGHHGNERAARPLAQHVHTRLRVCHRLGHLLRGSWWLVGCGWLGWLIGWLVDYRR